MKLRPYQEEAIEAVREGLGSGGRGQLHAACGSGKTFMSVLAGRQLVTDGLVVVLVPSLSLIAQTLTQWQEHADVDAFLAVCSDPSVTDEDPTRVEDLPAGATTDPQTIGQWLTAATGRRLLVGTYASAGRVAQALRHHQPADLLILDEAHHLAGRIDAQIRRLLDDAYLPAVRRLFMTATPRVDPVRDETTDLVSMSDQRLFGPVLYSYPWSRAISEGWLDDYRVVVIGVREKQLVELLRDERDLVDSIGGPSLADLAAQTIIAQAAQTYGLRRIIVFSSRLETSREFTRTLPSTLQRLPNRPAGPLRAERIDGQMPHSRRTRVLDALRRPPEGGWTVVSNVRVLTEGVDVPAVDAVAFTRPKSSQVDVVQAVGRALRRSSPKQDTATVLVPIVVPDSGEDIGDLEPGEYRVLWQVLRALRAHDDALGIELDTQRSHLSTDNPELPSRITLELPPGTTDSALRAIKALAVRQTTSVWWEGYGHARAFHEAHGHLTIPASYITEDGFNLGYWISNTRFHFRKGWLPPERKQALDDLGMVWEVRLAGWERFVDELRTYREEFGDADVPQAYVSPTGYRLGQKTNSARAPRSRHTVPARICHALDNLGMIWNTDHLRLQETVDEARTYAAEHGHLQVPKHYVTPSGCPLGHRLARLRAHWAKGTIDRAVAQTLMEMGWEPEPLSVSEKAWEKFIAACDRYVARHGSLADVHRAHVDEQGYALGKTINYYRSLHTGTKPGGVPPQRRRELDARGMNWEAGLPPSRELLPMEAQALRQLPPPRLGQEVLRLVGEEKVRQKAIADALGVRPSTLSLKLKEYRTSGHWPDHRSRARSR